MVEPETDFENAVVDFCAEIGQMLIEKNRKYGDSFRNLRRMLPMISKIPGFHFGCI